MLIGTLTSTQSKNFFHSVSKPSVDDVRSRHTYPKLALFRRSPLPSEGRRIHQTACNLSDAGQFVRVRSVIKSRTVCISWIAPDSKLEYSWTIRWRFWLGASRVDINCSQCPGGVSRCCLYRIGKSVGLKRQMKACARTDTFTLKIESISEDLPECLCYGEGLIRPGTHHTMAGTYLSNDENSESPNGCCVK